jgi:hypothetical protein
MSQLELKISQGCQEPYIEFHVDEVDLGTLLKESLGKAGSEDVLPWQGIDYSISDTVLGEDARTKGSKRAILFACNCGCYACGSVFVDVHVDDATITLYNFSTHWRGEWVVAALGPIYFDRGQFEVAVSRLQSRLQEWRPAS